MSEGYGVGRNTIARQERRGTVLAVLEAGDQEAGELAHDGPVDAVPGGARKGVSEAAPSWLDAG